LHIEGRLPKKASSIHEWAFEIAERSDVNDAKIWFIKEDPCVFSKGGAHPQIVYFRDNGKPVINDEFKGFPISFTFVMGIPRGASPSTTPIGWTRGLRSEGRWDEDSVFGYKGGYIAFLDGHVEWYSNLDEDGGKLVNYSNGKRTCNIYEALTKHVSILDYKPNLK
jgi:prepilin-type processing-associated H-X9-DG protein